jgi:uncharacterized membrane protein YidH (DUF202 family)
MSAADQPASSDGFGPPSRRTYFAEERTLLAWWRTGLGSAAVAVAIGGLLPKLGGLPRDRGVALGIGYGLLGIAFVVGGTVRDQQSRVAIRHNSFASFSGRAVWAFTIYTSALVVLTVLALL